MNSPANLSNSEVLKAIYELAEKMVKLRKDGIEELRQKDYVINVILNIDTIMINQNTSVDLSGGGTNNAPITGGVKNMATSTTTITQPPELQLRLDALTAVVNDLALKLPEAVAKRVRRNLDTLKEQATSEEPESEWYELSAKGLKEAANTVVELAAPVTAAVNAVLALITGNS